MGQRADLASQSEQSMPDADVEALVLLIKYSEQEAVRLRLSPVVVHCLRMAGEELNSTVRPTVGVLKRLH